jgi:hypothetical protein
MLSPEHVELKVHRFRDGFSVGNALLLGQSLPAFIGHNLDKIGDGTVLYRGHLFQFVPLLITHRQVELRFGIMSNHISESAAPLHRVQPFQVRKVRERSFFSRVFGGSRPTDAEAALENLIAERGLENLDVVAIENCLHQYGIRDAAVRPLLLQIWRHAVERFVATDGFLDNLEAAFLDQLKELFGLGEVEANNERYSVLTAEFMDRARPLISRLDAQSEKTRSRISRVARQLRISPEKQKSLLKNLAQASLGSILKYWIGKRCLDTATANALLAFKDEYDLSLADSEQNKLLGRLR